jgi:hypothetical protein
MWKEQLITLYCTVCQHYSSRVEPFVQRLSNNCRPQFTDEELITVYLWGIIQRQFERKQIHRYTKMHLMEWFPMLPSYQAFNYRLNELAPAFQEFASILLDFPSLTTFQPSTMLVDSLPVILAKQARSSRAKVSPELCSKSYCSSKDQWYYGMKLHLVGRARYKQIPLPVILHASTASTHDLIAAEQMLASPPPTMQRLYADKAYCDATWKHNLAKAGIQLFTPLKKPRGLAEPLYSSDCFSSFVSRVRQPIESFFNWLNEKTGIQIASKVRSTKGLLVHIFGRIAAALCILALNFNS